MKKVIYSILALVLMGTMTTSCSDLLELESKTSITNSWLYETPEGLSRAVVGLYDMDRKIAENPSEGADIYAVQMFDYCTDLLVFRSGTNAAMARLTYNPSQGIFNSFWTHYYNVIGKANEVIAAAEKMDLTDPTTLRAWGEAKFFRGRSYFELWKRFERLYLNVEATTTDNLQREFVPASTEDIFTVIRGDLDDAVEALDWAQPEGAAGTEHGRVTKGTAMHVRAQVAMWDKDWDTAITLCEEVIGATAFHKLEDKPEDAFLKSADLRSKEFLWTYQFSLNPGGGGNTSTPPIAHRYQLVTLAAYHGLGAYFEMSAEYGGYGWGRCYPNSYLMKMFDQKKDSRYTKLMRTEWIINKTGHANYGQVYDMTQSKGKAEYMTNLHPMTLKFYDCWSNAGQPDLKTSYKDLPIYRLGETVLMCAEAYMERDGEGSTRALELYNMTWERAGNAKRIEPLTMDELLNEYARECYFEGVRWPLLKRRGILAERVKLHGGDTKADDPYLNADYAHPRELFIEGKHEVWPIPQAQIDLMGAENFPQHDAWL
ncbi:MAG: RagB/SusD family nutrient uptake outer membrane protein [Alistipes sp.]|nr:RagB/SusD family nutrient uptake outer membrane protein [Alistipes sp.]